MLLRALLYYSHTTNDQTPANIIHSALAPGGYYEIQDGEMPPYCDDSTMDPDCALMRWQKALIEASAKLGRRVGDASADAGYLKEVGFVDVQSRKFKWPSNSWPRDPYYKELGTWQLANIDNGIEGFTLALFTRVLGWTQEEVLVLCSQVRKDIRNPKIHAYWNLYDTPLSFPYTRSPC